MNPISAWKVVVLARYAKFDGRASRAEFWWFALANLVIYIVLAALAQASNFFFVLYVLYGLAVLIPSIAVAVRRLHDTNRSGWWVLISLIPLVGSIILIVLLALPGEPRPNAYGGVPSAAVA
jgi:uncharacterized membrane protein YhaH (DUF805 family)